MRVLTMGTFDLLHPGHVQLFRWCRHLAGEGGHVTVTVNRDEFVERYKGRRPVMDQEARYRVLLGMADVDTVAIHGGNEDSTEVIAEHLSPFGGLIVIGADWRDRDYLAQLGVTQQWLDEHLIVVVYVPLLAGHSSTALREAMA